MSKFKISKDDLRIGNFVFHEEKGHIKVSDLNGNVTHRISTWIAKGQVLKAAMDGLKDGDSNMERYLENYAVVTFNFLSAVPDADLHKEVLESTIACINRHKDVYGIKDDITPEEDAKILDEEKNLEKALEEARKEE